MPAVLTERDGHALIVTLNRPERQNAINGEMLVRLYDACVEADTNDDIRCLAAHRDDVQKCSAAVADATYSHADEQAAAAAVGALFVSPQPWICTDQCEPVIADHAVYQDADHLTQAYAEYLTGALGEALQPVLDQA